MLIRFKSIDRIEIGEISLFEIGMGLGAIGAPLKEKIHERLAKAHVQYLPTVTFSREEVEKHNLRNISKEKKQKILLDTILNQFYGHISRYRDNLLRRTKNIYTPFSEKPTSGQSPFKERNKTQMLSIDDLFKSKQENIEEKASLIGSELLIKREYINFYQQMIDGIFKTIANGKTTTLPTNSTAKKRNIIDERTFLNKYYLHSVRLQSEFDNGSIRAVGDAIAWHAVDTMVRFLYTIININKDRIERQCQISSNRYTRGQNFDTKKKIQYPEQLLKDSALGVLLHAIGLSHESIHEKISTNRILDPKRTVDKVIIKQIRKNINVTHNLFRNRDDIPATAKEMYKMQHAYPDGTGYPNKSEHRPLSELVRIFHIVDFYDELTNPILNDRPYGRMDTIEYMRSISGEYKYNPHKFEPGSKLDSNLLEEFLKTIKPYPEGEVVQLYPRNDRTRPHYTGKVQIYKKNLSPIPMILIVKDYKEGKQYPIGHKLFDIENGYEYTIRNKKYVKTQNPILQEYIIYDHKINPGDITKYKDIFFAEKREVYIPKEKKSRFRN